MQVTWEHRPRPGRRETGGAGDPGAPTSAREAVRRGPTAAQGTRLLPPTLPGRRALRAPEAPESTCPGTDAFPLFSIYLFLKLLFFFKIYL